MEDDDFPFNFGSVSDSGEDADGLFCAPKQKPGTSRTKPLAEQEPYSAHIEEDGWFHRTGKSVEELMMLKNGAIKVKMRADHYYMLRDGGLRRPEEATNSGTGVLKVTDSKEMQEMALRCALKLGKFDEAAILADHLALHDTGVVFLKAKAYMMVGRHNDAAIGLVQFQKTRSSNYAIWKLLAECLFQSGVPAGKKTNPRCPLGSGPAYSEQSRVTTALALMSVLRARHLMRVSNWTQIDYAQARYNREMEAIESQRLAYEQDCGLQSREAEQTCGDKEVARAELESRYDLKVIKPAQERLRTMKEEGLQQLVSEDGSFAVEIVEFVVSSWDPQVLGTASFPAAGDDVADEVVTSVRSK